MTRAARLALLALAAAAQAAAPRAAGAAPTRLLVIDETGLPVAGAQVVEAKRADRGLPVFDASAPALGATDAAGVLAPLPTTPGGGELAVFAPGKAAALLPASDGAVSVVLWRASPIEGELRMPDGSPARGIELRALPATGVADLAHRARSGEDGRYALAHLPPGRFRVAARRPAGAWQDVGVVVAGARAPTTTLSRGAMVQGRVLDGDTARAVALLDVELRPLAVGGIAVAPRAEGDPVDAEGLTAVTDPQGRFQLPDVTPGFYEPVLADPALAWDPAPPLVEVRSATVFRLETWWVLARVAVRGRAIDPERNPVAGARATIAPLSSDAPPPGGFVSGPSEAATGPDGTFRIEGVFPGLYRIAVVADGASAVVLPRVEVSRRTGADVGDVVIEAAWTLEVEVLSGEGAPVEGARVVALPADRPGPADADAISRALARAAATDAQGKATIPGQSRGPVRVRVAKPGFLELARDVPDPRGSPSRLVRLRLASAGALSGRVEAPAGAPTAPAVRATNRRTGVTTEAEVGDDGTFRFDDLLPEPTDVEAVSPAGLVLARVEGVSPGADVEVVLRTVEGREVAGTVEGLDEPGPAGVVRLEAPRRDAVRDEPVWEVVDRRALPAGARQGAFSFEGVPPGTYALRAVQGLRDVRVDVTVGGEDRVEAALRLPEGGSIEGEVRDAVTERARAGVRVRLVRLQGDGFAPPGAAAPEDRVTGADGLYAFEGLALGLWRVSASDRDSPEVWKDVRVSGGRPSRAPDLFLPEGGRLEGTIEAGPGRRPLAGVPVRLRRLPGLEGAGSATTREDGTFLTAALAPGRYRVRALEDDVGVEDAPFLEADVEVVAGRTTRVALGALGRGRIEGTVFRGARRVGGVRLSAALVGPAGADALVVRGRTDDGGAFGWDGLPAGRYRLRVEEDAVERVEEVALADGDRAIVRLELADGRIEGRVRTTDGAPVSGAEVWALPVDAGATDALGRATSAGDGAFAIEGLPIGIYRLVVAPPSLPPRVLARVTADLRGSGAPADVVVGDGATLEVVAVDEGGRPVPAAAVWVDSPEAVALHRRPWFTGPDGIARVEGLPPGLARVRVHARGLGRPAPRLLELRAAAVDRVETTLREGGSVRLVVVRDGVPVPRARVEVLRDDQPIERRRSLFPEEEGSAWGTTDVAGVLLLEDLEEGPYALRVRAPDGSGATSGALVRVGTTTDATAILE